MATPPQEEVVVLAADEVSNMRTALLASQSLLVVTVSFVNL